MIYKKKTENITLFAHKYNGTCSCLWTLQLSGQLLQPKLAFITPCPPSYLTVDRFYYLLALPEQSQSPTDISAVKNGFYPRFSIAETRSFIQDCQQNSSYYVPHNANSNMCYRNDNDGYLHNWFVSTLQNHTIYLRVR